MGRPKIPQDEKVKNKVVAFNMDLERYQIARRLAFDRGITLSRLFQSFIFPKLDKWMKKGGDKPL